MFLHVVVFLYLFPLLFLAGYIYFTFWLNLVHLFITIRHFYVKPASLYYLSSFFLKPATLLLMTVVTFRRRKLLTLANVRFSLFLKYIKCLMLWKKTVTLDSWSVFFNRFDGLCKCSMAESDRPRKGASVQFSISTRFGEVDS